MTNKLLNELSDNEIIAKYIQLEKSLDFAEKNQRTLEAEEIEITMAMLGHELSRRYRA